MSKIAIILSGCGVYDGAEIHESVLAMYFVEKFGASFECFAPDIPQLHVINHLNGEVADESRNVLVESARIARGNVKPISELDGKDFDALIVPGGFGVAKNLCDFALKGADSQIQPEVLAACKTFAELNKPAGYACIAPALLTHVYGANVKLTIGSDAETSGALNAAGANHEDCKVDDIVFDEQNKVVTTPAYMLAQSISEAAVSIEKMVSEVIKLTTKNN